MTSDYVNFLNENIHTATRFTDSSPVKPAHHAEICEDTVTQFAEYLQQGLVLDHELVKRWLGQYRSDNKSFEDISGHQENGCHDVDYEALIRLTEKSTLIHSP